MATEPNPIDWPPAAWLWHAKGYTNGIRDGYTAGYQQAIQDLLGDMAWIIDHRPSRAIPHHELQHRRNTYTTPALTPEQIQTHAAASWAETATG